MAMQVLWSLAPRCPLVILEANFRTASQAERERFAGLPGRKVEVHCHCSPEQAKRRFAARATKRHPAHTLHILSSELLTEYDQPFAMAPTIMVHTDVMFDLQDLLQSIREHWPDLALGRPDQALRS